jgi:hypothetical protein
MHLRTLAQRLLWLGLAVVLIAFAVSCILFKANGGFGGGHGDHDPAIFLLSLPWSLGISALPETVAIHLSDRSIFVISPAALNLTVIGGIWLSMQRRKRKS